MGQDRIGAHFFQVAGISLVLEAIFQNVSK